jgi:glycosyltransferase involved in cell wall biosynthesis
MYNGRDPPAPIRCSVQAWSSVITFVLSTRGNVYGGVETIADRLAAGLAARGHAVTLIAGAVPGRLRRRDWPAGVTPLAVPVMPWTSPLLRAAARLARTSPLNLQSLVFYRACRAHPAAGRALASSTVVVTLLEGEAVLFSRWAARRGIGSVYYFTGGIDPAWARRERSTRRVAISQTVADHAAAAHGYFCHGVVAPGIDARLLAGPPAPGHNGPPARLLYIGRLERRAKRVDRLVPFFAALAPEFPELRLHLAGDGSARGALERSCADAGLVARVRFCGALDPAGVEAELRQADLLVLPSDYESFGIVALEAQAAGAPVLASDLPALREATGGHALFVAPDDAAGWVAAARGLLRDSARRRALSEAGRAWAAGCTWERVVERFEGFVVEARQARRNHR